MTNDKSEMTNGSSLSGLSLLFVIGHWSLVICHWSFLTENLRNMNVASRWKRSRRFPRVSVSFVSSWFVCALLCLLVKCARGDAGILISSNRAQPAPSILSLDDIAREILI